MEILVLFIFINKNDVSLNIFNYILFFFATIAGLLLRY